MDDRRVMESEGTWITYFRAMPGGVHMGYPVTPKEIEAFEGLIKETAPRMTEDERALTGKHLVDHLPNS